MFSDSLREQIAKAVVQIENVFHRELNPTCNLATSSLRTYMKNIVSIIQLTIASTLQDFTQPRPQNDEGLSDSTEHVNKIRPSQATQGQGEGQRPTVRGQKRRKRPKKPVIDVRGSEIMNWTARSK